MKIRVHSVKTWPDMFQVQEDGEKTFEIRQNDRGYQRGDVLLQKEFQPSSPGSATKGYFTGRQRWDEIVYILNGFGLQPGYVCLQLRRITADEAKQKGAVLPVSLAP